MNAKISVFVTCDKVIIFLLKYNLRDCTFKIDFHLSLQHTKVKQHLSNIWSLIHEKVEQQ